MVCGIRTRLACVGRGTDQRGMCSLGGQRWGEDDQHMLKDSTVAFAETSTCASNWSWSTTPRWRKEFGDNRAPRSHPCSDGSPNVQKGRIAAEAAWVDTP